MGQASLEFTGGLKVIGEKPEITKYFNNAGTPYTGTPQAISETVGVRHQGMTVNIAGVEYWWKDGILDGHLVIKRCASLVDATLSGNGNTESLSVENQKANYITAPTVAGTAIALKLNQKNVVRGYLLDTTINLDVAPVAGIENHWVVWFVSNVVPNIVHPKYTLGNVTVDIATPTTVTGVVGSKPSNYKLFIKPGQTITFGGQDRTVTEVYDTYFKVGAPFTITSPSAALTAMCRWVSAVPVITAYNVNQFIYTKTQLEAEYYILTATNGTTY